MDKAMLVKVNKVVEIVKNVVVWALVAVSVFMMIFTVISVSFFDHNDRKFLGYRIYAVASDSMSATDFSAGDIIFSKVYKDYSNLEEGDIISFISINNDDSYQKTVTHKIRRAELNSSGEVIGYVTYGTTTNTNDEAVVTFDLIQGVYKGKLPKIGYFFDFVRSTVGYILCILIPFALLIMWQGVNCVRLFRRYKAEQMDEIQAEKEEIAKERDELQSMMLQLMELKSQLSMEKEARGAAVSDMEVSKPAADVNESSPAETLGVDLSSEEITVPVAEESVECADPIVSEESVVPIDSAFSDTEDKGEA